MFGRMENLIFLFQLLPWQPINTEYAFCDIMWSAVYGDHGVGLVKEL
jgi:undecaprenyl pyrophosphate synthase